MVSPMRRLAWPFCVTLALVSIGATPRQDASGEYESRMPDHETMLRVLSGPDQALFSYMGSFGPGCTRLAGSWCRTCDLPPTLARRDGPESYSVTDQYGTVRLAHGRRGWTLTLLSGMFGWCGMGWSADSFALKGRAPHRCTVTAAAARLYAPATGSPGAPQPTDTTLKPGQRIEAFAAAHTEDSYTMAQVGGRPGLIRIADVDCKS
jgi:hypothetical protein